MESLAHTFVFAGLWLYLVGRQRQLAGEGGRWWIAAGLFGCTALGILSKESAVLLPLYAWLAEACMPGAAQIAAKGDLRKLYAAVLWLPLVAGLVWLYRASRRRARSSRAISASAERLLTEARVVLDYLHWTLVPQLRELSLYHDDYVVSRGWCAAVDAVRAAGDRRAAALAWWLRARRPLVALGMLWFLAAQALTATVIPLELVYEHRNYFASLGVAGAGRPAAALPRGSMQRIGALVAILLALGYRRARPTCARVNGPIRSVSPSARRTSTPVAACHLRLRPACW